MAKEEKSEGGGMRKIAAFIVDKRNLFFLLYVVALVFCLFSRNWVEVENDITTYLPEETETRRGLTVMNDNTIKFVVPEDSSEEMKTILTAVYGALSEKGYNPINQIVGYLLSEDPTYITNYNNARSLICKLDRDELLQELVKHYLFS